MLTPADVTYLYFKAKIVIYMYIYPEYHQSRIQNYISVKIVMFILALLWKCILQVYILIKNMIPNSTTVPLIYEGTDF